MKVQRTFWTALGLFALLFSTPLLAQRPVTLRLNLEKGKTYTVSMSTQQDISQTIMGQDNNIQQEIGFTYALDVLGKKRGGEHDVDLTFTKVKFANETPMGGTNYDSENPDSEPDMQSMAYAAMVDQTLGMKMNNTGEITDITGINEFLNHLVSFYGIPEGPQREEVRALIDQQFSAEQMMDQFSQLTIVYPENAVKVGDSWEQTQEVTAGFPLNLVNTYTVQSIEGGEVTLSLSSEVSMGKMTEPMQMNGMEMMYKLKGTQTGTIIVDAKTGWTQSSQITQNLAGTVDLLPNAQLPDGMSWPISLVSDVNIVTE
ncbi:MAG TPA: hypothetical protein DCE41_12190 [Cytophagales bacterium]|nr:hypothetical protein [Cytophagales bacterium]HAA19157.1 hypothetical protein [Cytophagales bacterium]HAP60770.1 hypothetical protein [Cytophagales bacterium]